MSETILVAVSGNPATITLNRPNVHNAFDESLIADLTAALADCERDPSVRAVVLTGAGVSFSAGADPNWMRSMATLTQADNRPGSLRLATLMPTLNFPSKPTPTRVHAPSPAPPGEAPRRRKTNAWPTPCWQPPSNIPSI